MVSSPEGCRPQCPQGFHYHQAIGHTSEGVVENYEAGRWAPVDPSHVRGTAGRPRRAYTTLGRRPLAVAAGILTRTVRHLRGA